MENIRGKFHDIIINSSEVMKGRRPREELLVEVIIFSHIHPAGQSLFIVSKITLE